ncbi:HNH endonuclease family protein [uncultured Corynebacterium sp.]|uniref:HNH endonuclease family protein n=1 Tax=uncultured Corynebacterium sp. TaxID=159447 RepID=UPI0025DC5832|nr:HNH endonuclease family protein [uncultured Corynebacterium sp.]
MKTFIRLLAVFTLALTAYTAAPFLNPDKPELAAVKPVTQRVRIIGYDRETRFGTWQSGVREAVVSAAGETDPYSGEPLDLDSAEVDHILPLSAAWDLGAHSWSAIERIRFANDPSNLVLVNRSENQTKSDQLPSEWLPSHQGSRCWYAQRMFAVAAHYELPLPEADIRVGRRSCGFVKTGGSG